MKNSQVKVFRTFLFIGAFLVVLVAVVPLAFADPSVSVKPLEITIKPIEVSGLKNYQGQFLTAIYATGGTGILFSSDLNLRKIKIRNTLPINGETASFPAVAIPAHSGLEAPYNYVILVIHPSLRANASFKWVNSKDTQLQGTETGNSSEITRFNSLTESNIRILSHTPGNETVIHYKFD